MNEIKTKYVVLGSGAAGVTAAKAIRDKDSEGRIVLVSSEEEMTYKRPMLSKTPCARCDLPVWRCTKTIGMSSSALN